MNLRKLLPALLLVGGCDWYSYHPVYFDDPVPELPPGICDAGDEAWVQRVMPLIWGRKPHGAHEVRIWAHAAENNGREVVVRAMTEDPEYLGRWRDFLTDALEVHRTGDREFSTCFAQPNLAEDTGQLATFLASNPPLDTDFGQSFTMADVVKSALQADNLSVVWRANLFTRMYRPMYGANVGPEELEISRRDDFGEGFFSTYLHRNLTCMPCHNSEFSVTGSDDPAKDRTWEVPGQFERALFGDPKGLDKETAYAIFRYTDLVESGGGGKKRPWGMDQDCGRFSPPGALDEDYLDHSSFFISDWGEAGSVWDLEAALHEGVDGLGVNGIKAQDDGSLKGQDAFAYLVAQTVVDRVWEEATGYGLTLAHDFPRNKGQRDRLQQLTNDFVEGGFSLRGLLVGIAMDETFNHAPPEQCPEALAYGLDPIFAPFSPQESDPPRRRNGAGDQVKRHTARVLMRSVHDSLGWKQTSMFPGDFSAVGTLQADLGAFARSSQPGFNGTDFQSILAFEAAYGACEPTFASVATPATCGDPAAPGCPDCACEATVCALDPGCCATAWSETCAYQCDVSEGCGPAGGQAKDVVDRIIDSVDVGNGTVGEMVSTLKDRLVADGEVSIEERVLMEALLDANFDEPLSEAGDVDDGLRSICGAILTSPDYFLLMAQGGAGEPQRFALEQAVDCGRLLTLMPYEVCDVTALDQRPTYVEALFP